MKGFIFAAGFGERLRPLTENIPKPLLPVLNMPAILYSLSLLMEAGIKEIIINLHYRSRDIIDYFEKHDKFGADIIFSIEENILGTGGGIKAMEKILREDDFVIINSDIITDADIPRLILNHRGSGSPATLLLYETEKAGEIGRIGVEGDSVMDFKNYLNTGLYSDYIYTGIGVLSPLIFDYLSPEFSSVVYTGYVDLVKHHSVAFVPHRGFWHDIGDHSSYYDVNINSVKDVLSLEKKTAAMTGQRPLVISPDSVIEESSEVYGSVIGKNVVLEKGSKVKNSLVLDNSVIPRGMIVENSIIRGDGILIHKE